MMDLWPFIILFSLLILQSCWFYKSQLRRRAMEGEMSAYRSLFEALPAAAYVYDANDFNILAVNQEAISLYGYSREDFLSLKVPDILMSGRLKPLLPGFSDQNNDFLESGRWRHHNKNGEAFYVQVFVRQLRFGKRLARLAVACDIAGLIATENLLSRKSAELQVLEGIADAFYMVDAAWHFTYVNKAYEKLHHRSRRDLLGKNVWQLFPYGKERCYYREYCHALRHQVPVHFEEFNPHSGMWVSVDAYPSESGLAVFCRDITPEKSAVSACPA